MNQSAQSAASSATPTGVIIVITDHHFEQTTDGCWVNLGLDYEYFQQYLAQFREVRVLARVASVAAHDPSWRRADGPGVTFVSVGHYRGLGSMLRALPRTWRAVRTALRAADYYAIRGGGGVCTLSWLWLRWHRRPYALQCVGSPREGILLTTKFRFAWFKQFLSRIGTWIGRRQAAGAACTAYVSQALARQLPPGPGRPHFFFSDVALNAEIVTAPRPVQSFRADPLKIISIGRLSPEKGYDVLLDALRKLDERGRRRWTADIIGPGADLQALREKADRWGLGDRVTFAGPVQWGPELFARLDRAELYVLPSLTEGMPRALLEAMARGLPVVATRVGGVPDLVDDRVLVPPADADALATAIGEYVAADPAKRAGGEMESKADLAAAADKLAALSAQCFAWAMQYHPDRMLAQKRAYWGHLKQVTDARRL
ncbi:MAG: glycosyltransferase family 4 protein [Phycisphaerales bacterium]|nr:glycosyltransferase family 4 protein [Phycisphaerales bacterium]